MALIAFLMDQDFEDSEFRVPHDRLVEAGHAVKIVGLEKGKVLAGKKGAESVATQLALEDAVPDGFDALVIPGGYSPDKLRTHDAAVAFTRRIFEAEKPVAAICHGGSLLVEAGVLEEKTVTSWPSIRTDMVNAGAEWVDREVVVDGNLVTSRKPDDLDAFCAAIESALSDASAASPEARS